MIAGTILGDRGFALGADGHKQIPRKCWIELIRYTFALVPRLAALKASVIVARGAASLPFAHAAGTADISFAIRCRAPLEVVVFACICRLIHLG